MADYALLILPSTNRVYADSSVALTVAELEVFNQSVVDGRIGDIARTELAGVPYVTFTADTLDESDIAYLANLSSMYALFRLDGKLLEPVPLHRLDAFDSDLITILKYQGKTNELFTKLLLNITLMSSARARDMLDHRLTVLDPMCGRGTTLNQAIMYGYDAAGIDLDQKDFEAYAAFLQTWLKRKRIKHHAEVVKVRRDKQHLGRRLQASIGLSKESYKAGDALSLTYVNADTTRARDFHRPESVDLIVTDAPYGVQHGSRAGQALQRTPLELLREAAPAWAKLLRPGGSIGIAVNTNVAPRADTLEILTRAGLAPLDDGPYRAFEHRVDQAIVRDIVIARKP
ncbi:TRM11 family SAM-dependent methyltransferase [Actinokineospora xionganensis]|uniref:SAM-dependent methyltransferase n=1 Tax=Actinokineospora xionganensis TaxID=2684470 RepID=A0ABR7LAV2_9PSEU|nr:SAM-dependent methyltransferase [Actinokineospora xionganensis]MBC6449845.1 SAM-dependent methyltransferase [Actinokineospora xionganensis]